MDFGVEWFETNRKRDVHRLSSPRAEPTVSQTLWDTVRAGTVPMIVQAGGSLLCRRNCDRHHPFVRRTKVRCFVTPYDLR